MTDKTIGTLKKVELKEIWEDEQRDFSPWLAKKENLTLLVNELGIDDISFLETETEASVGAFRVDILAQTESDERKIIIENQLGKTDHDHLGKLITYAAGYKASIVVWVFKNIREEHREAIDWLNDHTDEEISFFAVQIEAWKIDESPPAPKFQIISKPNEWAKTFKSEKKEISETKQKQLRFWTDLKEAANEKGAAIFKAGAFPSAWYSISIGAAGSQIHLAMDTIKNKLYCRLRIFKDKNLFDHLEGQKEAIESEIRDPLEWSEKKNVISQAKTGFNLDDESKRGEHFDWLIGRAGAFHKAFSQRVKNYDEESEE